MAARQMVPEFRRVFSQEADVQKHKVRWVAISAESHSGNRIRLSGQAGRIRKIPHSPARRGWSGTGDNPESRDSRRFDHALYTLKYNVKQKKCSTGHAHRLPVVAQS